MFTTFTLSDKFTREEKLLLIEEFCFIYS